MHFFADSELHPLIDNMSNTLASTAVVIFRVGHGYKMAGREGWNDVYLVCVLSNMQLITGYAEVVENEFTVLFAQHMQYMHQQYLRIFVYLETNLRFNTQRLLKSYIF